jgi:hypothetical protein
MAAPPKKSRVAAVEPQTPALVESAAPMSAALAELLALTAPMPATMETDSTPEADSPAIQGAVLNNNVVTLGLDPKFTAKAARAAKLNALLRDATKVFSSSQVELRDYGKAMRDAYNLVNRRDVTTVNVPYYAKVPKDPASETPGRKLEHVQVICTSRYSVAKDVVLKLEPELGEAFPKLFVKGESRYLKPNVEGLVKQILKDIGVPEERVESTMAVLFTTDVTVAAHPDYESEHKRLPEKTREILGKAVVRQHPSLKFLDH